MTHRPDVLLCYWKPCMAGPWLIIHFLGNCFTWFYGRDGDGNEYYRTSGFIQITYILLIHWYQCDLQPTH